jgi:peptidoglycan/LPS O-acetylase OafA/YrhL
VDRWAVPAWIARTAEALGNTAYSSYLTHIPLQIALLLFVHAAGIDKRIFVATWMPGFFVLLTFLVAYAVFLWFERPVQRFLRRRVEFIGT